LQTPPNLIWNCIILNGDHEAAYILQKMKQVGNAANSMSYWVFTDIFEESGPRFTPFHGGFGLLNYQGIKKPAYYAYSFMNKLGETELQNQDKESWACKNSSGGMQVLFWDFTNTHPGDSVNNQTYYIRNLPSKAKGTVRVEAKGIPSGKYKLEIYKVGYKVNDAYTTYFSMKRPNQLTIQQVNEIKSKNDGSPISSEAVKIDKKGNFIKDIILNENDVILLNFIRQ